jgi:hypothetical protein
VLVRHFHTQTFVVAAGIEYTIRLPCQPFGICKLIGSRLATFFFTIFGNPRGVVCDKYRQVSHSGFSSHFAEANNGGTRGEQSMENAFRRFTEGTFRKLLYQRCGYLIIG